MTLTNQSLVFLADKDTDRGRITGECIQDGSDSRHYIAVPVVYSHPHCVLYQQTTVSTPWLSL